MSLFPPFARPCPGGATAWLRQAAGRVAIAACVLATAGLATSVSAQRPAPAVAVSDTVVEVRLADGSVLFGRIVGLSGDLVTIEFESGARTDIDRSQIISVRRNIGRLVNGERWTDDPNATRLFFGPTGRAIGGGTGYFAVYQLLMPFVAYGVTDQISVSGGTPILPGVMGELFYAAPKVTLMSQRGVDLAAGVLAFFLPDEGESVGMAYGVSTFGSIDHALTLGVGVPFYAGGESDLGDRPAVMIGGEARFSRRAKLIGESYFVPGESSGVMMTGVRFFGERLSADAGVGFLVGEGGGCCLPVVNFVWVFGRQK